MSVHPALPGARTRVLVVEDEPQMQVILRDNLEYEGYEALGAETGEKGVELAFQTQPDLILLDLMLPGMSGYEVCRKLRDGGLPMPIIIITARNAEMDRILGLELGADDYVGKPFSVREVMARVKVQLRRRANSAEREPDEFKFGEITVDLRHHQARRRSRRIELSGREFELLRYFVMHRGEMVSRQQLLTDVWGYSSMPLTRTVDNFIAKLRRKIERDPQNPQHILTMYGTGYRFLP